MLGAPENYTNNITEKKQTKNLKKYVSGCIFEEE